MSKAVLVINNTGMCVDCRFCREVSEGIEAFCELCDEPEDSDMYRTIDVDYCQDKPKWCPLKEMPDKKKEKEYMERLDANNNVEIYGERTDYYAVGWNACIDKILKERD